MTKKFFVEKKRGTFFAVLLLALFAFVFLPSFGKNAQAVGLTYKNYTYELDGTDAVITAVKEGVFGEVEIPSKFGVVGVAAIGKEAFKNCENITAVTIPESVTLVEEGAFSGCTGLKKVMFLAENVKFESGVFENCKSLEEITMPKSSPEISGKMFSGCGALQKVVLPGGVESIGESAFENSALKEIAVPESVSVIKKSAFSGTKLERVTLPNGIKRIEANAFYGCELTDVAIPESVDFIGESAFAKCKLTGVIMTAMPVTVEKSAFEKGGDEKKQLVFFGFEETEVKKYAEENGFSFANIGCRHGFEELEVAERVEPGCIENGRQKGIFCKKCEAFVCGAAVIPATGHKAVLNKDVPSTCITNGTTGEKICSVCGELLEKGEPLPFGTHTPQNVVLKKATTNSNGTLGSVCSVCKKTLEKTTVKKIKLVYLSKTTYTYNKKTHTPSVTVLDADEKRLKKGTDYTVVYPSGRTKTGKYTVKVSFKGSYSGEVLLSFSIVPTKTARLTLAVKDYNVAAKWKKVPGADGYRVYLFREKTFMRSTDTTKTKITFKNLSKGAKYKIVVRAYKKDGKEKLFSVYSAGERFLTRPALPVLKTAKGAKGKAVLSWNEQKYVTGYVVYISEEEGKGFKKAKVVKRGNTCTITGLKKGKTYYFRLKSFKKAKRLGTVYSKAGKTVSVTVK